MEQMGRWTTGHQVLQVKMEHRADGEDGLMGNSSLWKSIPIGSTPTTGTFHIQEDTPPSLPARYNINIHTNDSNGVNFAFWIASMSVGDYIHVVNRDDTSLFGIYKLESIFTPLISIDKQNRKQHYQKLPVHYL